jgi:plasmid stabilization system protein ParE
MIHQVHYLPEAEAHLVALYDYLAAEASPKIANDYVGRLIGICESLSHHPERGVSRSDIRPGLRTIAYQKRAVIAYSLIGDVVTIIGIFTGGRDYASGLSE